MVNRGKKDALEISDSTASILLPFFFFKTAHNESDECKCGCVFFWKGKTHHWIEYKTFKVLMKRVILLFQCCHFIHPVTLQVVCFYTSSGYFSATGTLTGASEPFSFILRAHCQHVKMTMKYWSRCGILQQPPNSYSKQTEGSVTGLWLVSSVSCAGNDQSRKSARL